MNRVTVRWWEVVDSIGPNRGHFTFGGSQQTLVADVNFEDEQEFIKQTLGYGLRTPEGRLSRRTPARHPRYPTLRASDVAGVEHRAPKSVTVGGYGRYCVYQKSRVSLVFTSLPYAVKEDGEVTKEWQRFVSWEVDEGVEVITRKGGTFKFVDGPAAGQKFSRDQYLLASKGTLRLKWWNLPESWCFNASGRAKNIAQCMCKLNASPWPDVNGYGIGQLLLVGNKLIPRTYPIQPEDGGVLFNSTPRSYDVELTFGIFDPPTAPGYALASGWNLFPIPPQLLATPVQEFYLATMDGTAGGAGAYLYEDFDTIFQAVSLP